MFRVLVSFVHNVGKGLEKMFEKRIRKNVQKIPRLPWKGFVNRTMLV